MPGVVRSRLIRRFYLLRGRPTLRRSQPSRHRRLSQRHAARNRADDLRQLVRGGGVYQLLFTNAVGLAAVPGTDQLCVWEREGRVWTFQNSPGTTEKKLVLDLSTQCQGWDDSGLLGVAFHPGLATNHFVFVYYTWVKPGTVAGSPTTRPVPNLPDTYHDRLERYTLDANGVAVPGSVKIFVDLTDQTVWHHGGGMFFHPGNGFLYWTDGDNSVGDNDQIINKSLYSGVFRIDVDCRGGKVSHAPLRQPTGGFSNT